MNLSQKVAHNMAAQIIAKVVATALGLAAVAIMTRSLGQTGFGEYTTIITFLSFFGIVADLGLTLITVQMISQPEKDIKKILNNLFGLRLVSAVLLLGLAPIMVIFFPYSQTVKFGVLAASLSFFFISLSQILIGLFQKELRMDKASIAEVIGRFVFLIGILWVVKTGQGILGMAWITSIASGISFLFYFLFSRTYVFIKPQFDFQLWKKIIKKSWPIALTIVLNLIYLKSDILFLSLIKTQAEVGLYGAAYKVIDILITIPFMFAGIILPVITKAWAEKNKEKFKNALQRSFDFMVVLAVPLTFGTQLIDEQVMALLAGSEFVSSGPVLRILILAASLIFLGCIFAHAVIALNKQKKIINAYVFTSLTALTGYLIFIPRFSYFGAAWVTIYSEMLIFIASFYYVWKYSGFFPNFKIFFKAIFASLLMGGGFLLLPSSFYNARIGLILTILGAIVFYFSLLYLFKAIKKEDLMLLKSK